MKNRLSTFVLFVILFVGCAILLYPSFSNYYNSFHQSRAIASYVEQVTIQEKDYSPDWEKANAYNATLPRKQNRFYLSDAERAEYESVLDATGTGIMGYIEIPSIKVSLPVYHGVSDAILQVAIGHIEGSSFPTGEVGTHVALSGHRGLPSAMLFTQLDKLELGDTFSLTVLNKLFTYEVDQIRIVLPNELQDLAIDPEQTYCTLVTCTPYGINSHRMLVRGHLIDNPEAEVQIRIVADANQIEPLLVAPVVAAPILLLLLIVMLISTSGGNKKRKER